MSESSLTPPLLSAIEISKRFPGVVALDRVSFLLRAGEIHALMGENGAGKSTLIKVLTGLYPHDGGRILLEGKAIHPRTPLQAQAAGISTVYQEVNLVPELSVAENLYLGRQPTLLGCKIRWRALYDKARQAMARLDLELDVKRSLSSYSIAIQQMVAIARAVDVQARVLVLDEPTSSLDAREVASLFSVMRRLKSQGLGLIFVTHFLDQVYEITDRLTVLRNGKLVGEYKTAEFSRLALVSAMIGRDASALVNQPASQRIAVARSDKSKGPFLSVRGLARTGAIAPFDMDIRGGEVVGLAGLLGAGRSESARLLFGAERADQGTMSVESRPVHFRQPRQAIKFGIAFCGEDRKLDGIIPDLSLRENIVLALQGRRGWLRRISGGAQEKIARKFIAALKIAAADTQMPLKLLSGGNQQKALLARWLVTEPRLLILDEPTRGIDVGAKFEIAALLEELCRNGMGLLFISSELEEVARLCHRVLVLRDRKVIGHLEGENVSEHNIMSLIAGSEPALTGGGHA
ncbi:MAG: sugar ABC transporter ATP-binding protein [Tepidisphaeraceae bacterium]